MIAECVRRFLSDGLHHRGQTQSAAYNPVGNGPITDLSRLGNCPSAFGFLEGFETGLELLMNICVGHGEPVIWSDEALELLA